MRTEMNNLLLVLKVETFFLVGIERNLEIVIINKTDKMWWSNKGWLRRQGPLGVEEWYVQMITSSTKNYHGNDSDDTFFCQNIWQQNSAEKNGFIPFLMISDKVRNCFSYFYIQWWFNVIIYPSLYHLWNPAQKRNI